MIRTEQDLIEEIVVEQINLIDLEMLLSFDAGQIFMETDPYGKKPLSHITPKK